MLESALVVLLAAGTVTAVVVDSLAGADVVASGAEDVAGGGAEVAADVEL